jgi:hypothetical protein
MADIFTQAGEEIVADFVDGTANAPTNWYIGWGTGAGTAAKGDTTLFTEASEARVIATESQPAADQNRFVGTITCAGAGKTITNAGVLSASTVGTLLLKSDFTGVALNVGDSIQFTFTITWS